MRLDIEEGSRMDLIMKYAMIKAIIRPNNDINRASCLNLMKFSIYSLVLLNIKFFIHFLIKLK